MAKNIKDILLEATQYPAAIEAMLPAGAPPISASLVDITAQLPVIPDFPMDVPDLPPPPQVPALPIPPGPAAAALSTDIADPYSQQVYAGGRRNVYSPTAVASNGTRSGGQPVRFVAATGTQLYPAPYRAGGQPVRYAAGGGAQLAPTPDKAVVIPSPFVGLVPEVITRRGM